MWNNLVIDDTFKPIMNSYWTDLQRLKECNPKSVIWSAIDLTREIGNVHTAVRGTEGAEQQWSKISE